VSVGLGTTLVLCVVYSITLARGVTYWDAGEFLAAIHALGIPHPPGTAVFILAARVWADLFSPLLGFTIAVNAFSAVCTAAGFGILGVLMARWIRDRLGAWAAAVCAGLTSTVWLNATETEVYACAFLVACVILWVASQMAESGEVRWLMLGAYLCGLAWALHLTALLVVPAVLVLIAPRVWHERNIRVRDWIGCGLLAVLGVSAVLYLLIRARHDPAINQGNPSTWSALWDVLQRHQYAVAPLWPRRAPWWLQIGNMFEYADWQFALGLHMDPGPSWVRTPITVLCAAVGMYGCYRHRRADRPSWRALMTFFVTGSFGVVVYLNLRAGPSFGYGVLAATAAREARERDYFFTFGFVCWALWVGYGTVQLVARGHWLRRVAAMSIVCIPLVSNWRDIRYERHDEQQAAEHQSFGLLDNVPRNGIFLAVGDNDTYPLWYLQEVQGIRRDVTIVTVPLLSTVWYRQEIARRHALLPPYVAVQWLGLQRTVEVLRQTATAQSRTIVCSPFAIQPQQCVSMAGLR
jgi:hypothetical protein